MTGNASRDLLYALSGIIMLVRTYQLVRMNWSRPLAHGPGFFLAWEVPSGFYEGAGATWLQRFRTVLVAEYLTEWLALIVVASTAWRWLPAWAGGCAVLYIGSLSLFGRTAHRALDRPAGTQSTVAVSFETRRIGDYVSWVAEGVMAGLVAGSWMLVALRGDQNVRWLVPATSTYVVASLFVAKLLAIRAAAPLPAQQTERHYHYMEAGRRYSLLTIDAMRWFFAILLAAYAVLHAGLRAVPWLPALVAWSLGLAWFGVVVAIIVRAQRLRAMGRDLRPAASWTGPYRTSPWASRGAGIWAVSFVAGLVALFAIFGF